MRSQAAPGRDAGREVRRQPEPERRGHQRSAPSHDTARLSAVGNQAVQTLARAVLVDESLEESADEQTRRPRDGPLTGTPAPRPSRLPPVLAGPGRPLGRGLRGIMERHFGVSFEDVRVHTDGRAADVAARLNARALTSGTDIVFGRDRFQPEQREGRQLLAHELAHVVQQAQRPDPAGVLQRQPAPLPSKGADPASPPTLKLLPNFGRLTMNETAKGAELIYGSTGKIFIEVQSAEVPKAKAYAVNYFPATLKREFDIIRIAAAPGVSVRPYGFGPFPSFKDPALEIYRVQDAELIPGRGESISPAALTGKSKVDADPNSTEAIFKHHQVVVDRQPNGVDILNLDSRQALKVRAPADRGDAKFSYQIKLGGERPLGPPAPTVVTVVKTKAVEVSFVGLVRGALNSTFVPRVYEVDTLAQVPVQGSTLKETGRSATFKAEVDETLEETLAMASVDIGIGLIPVVGDLVDIAELGYGLATGRDRWGRKLSMTDLALMGVGALLPFISGAALRAGRSIVRGGIKVAAEAGKNADQASRIVRGLSSLADDELAQVRRWDDLLRRGHRIPEGELEAARAILAKIGRAAPGEGVSASTGRTMRELLNDAGSGFRDPDLQEAYRRFLSEADATGERLDPAEWLRTTQGRQRAAVEAYLGPQAAAIEFAANADDYLAALRSESRARGAVGRAWDYKRFPQLPDGVKWRVGDPIDMPNTKGNYPSFDTARKRHWMNRAQEEIDARAGGAVQDAASADPVGRLTDGALQDMLKNGTAPPDPFQAGRKVELEHSGVPQRVVNMINDLGGSFATDKLRLAGVADPRQLLEVTPLEHAFFDYYAHTSHIPGRTPVVNPARADVAGTAWELTPMGDLRRARPLERMSDETLLDLVQKTRDANANFNRTPNTRALRDAINEEIALRGLPTTPIP